MAVPPFFVLLKLSKLTKLSLRSKLSTIVMSGDVCENTIVDNFDNYDNFERSDNFRKMNYWFISFSSSRTAASNWRSVPVTTVSGRFRMKTSGSNCVFSK